MLTVREDIISEYVVSILDCPKKTYTLLGH